MVRRVVNPARTNILSQPYEGIIAAATYPETTAPTGYHEITRLTQKSFEFFKTFSEVKVAVVASMQPIPRPLANLIIITCKMVSLKAVKRTLNPIIKALVSISFLRPNLSANGAKKIAQIAIPINPELNTNPSVLGPRFKSSAMAGAQ